MYLPNEIWVDVCMHLTHKDRFAMYRAGRISLSIVLNLFFDAPNLSLNWKSLQFQLIETQSVIKGSTATLFFSGIDFQPNDIDIYLHAPSQLANWTHYLEANLKRVELKQNSAILHRLKGIPIQLVYPLQTDYHRDIDNTANLCSISGNQISAAYFNFTLQGNIYFFRPATAQQDPMQWIRQYKYRHIHGMNVKSPQWWKFWETKPNMDVYFVDLLTPHKIV